MITEKSCGAIVYTCENSTVKYVINDKGDIIIMGEDITYSYASFGETKTNDVENTSNFSM